MQQQSATGTNRTDQGGAGSSSIGSGGTSTSDLMDQAKQTASRTQHLAGDLAGQVKREASNRLSGQIDNAAQGISGASQALKSVSEQLQKEQPQLANYAERAAEQIEHVSSYLKGKDLDQLVQDVESFARRQPAAFLGSAFVLGLAAARFLKSSSGSTGQESTQMDHSRQFNPGQTSGTGTQPVRTPPFTSDLYPTQTPPTPSSVVDAAAVKPSSSSPASSTTPSSSSPGSSITPGTSSPGSSTTPGTSSPAASRPPGASTYESGQPSTEPWTKPGTAA
jgi:hypothetical protein